MSDLLRKNPRWAIASSLLLLVTFLLLASGFISPVTPELELPKKGGTKSFYGSLANILAKQEEAYQDTIKRREGLIMRWGGGNRDTIAIFPGKHDSHHFYTLWDFLIPAFSCPYPVSRVGTLGDGGKWVCGVEKVISQPKCIIYSFGVNGESSFEAEILSKSSTCEFWGYDFSVLSWGPQIEENSKYKERSHFFPYRFDAVDDHNANPPLWTLKALMKRNGHTFVDILKVDIERSELDVFPALVKQFDGQDLPFGQLQLEIHAWNINFKDFLDWWEMLEKAGLRPFWTEPNLPAVNWGREGPPDVAEWSFLNIKGNHALLVD